MFVIFVLVVSCGEGFVLWKGVGKEWIEWDVFWGELVKGMDEEEFGGRLILFFFFSLWFGIVEGNSFVGCILVGDVKFIFFFLFLVMIGIFFWLEWFFLIWGMLVLMFSFVIFEEELSFLSGFMGFSLVVIKWELVCFWFCWRWLLFEVNWVYWDCCFLISF